MKLSERIRWLYDTEQGLAPGGGLAPRQIPRSEEEIEIVLGEIADEVAQLEEELKEERYAIEQYRRANEGLAVSKEKLEASLSIAMGEGSRCTCKEYEYEEHSCPFAKDVHNDSERCTCCPYCTDRCAQDV